MNKWTLTKLVYEKQCRDYLIKKSVYEKKIFKTEKEFDNRFVEFLEDTGFDKVWYVRLFSLWERTFLFFTTSRAEMTLELLK